MTHKHAFELSPVNISEIVFLSKTLTLRANKHDCPVLEEPSLKVKADPEAEKHSCNLDLGSDNRGYAWETWLCQS